MGRSPGGEHVDSLNILAWRIPTDRGTWWAAVHCVAESDTAERLSICHFVQEDKDETKNLNVLNMNVLTWCHITNALGHSLRFDYDQTERDAYGYYIKEATNTSYACRGTKTTGYTAQQMHQIWDQYMWTTPEKGQLIKTAPICWKQNNHTKLYPDSTKPSGFSSKSLCHPTITVNHMNSADSVI